ncbi:fimbrial major subunit StfA [Salmonella enterica subsp. enterica serovar Enteritidis]|nr:fimbrial protein [Salmonella enterica subsp. enterica serovar Enteritidis]EJI6251880.1 fimbrial major subunit StfA [Salmonella enterica]EBU9994176.1 fimbrial protein [Salmonella enterica subsp. enterica serovar Enteritidis]EBV2740821.1 fimbrial protein [Salmonella enterica subsp. enterica serovar Enteritidis]ECD6028183.1 fimbrial major subunit StfA [Salmonella enterica subsp. enterica serovar Enteritidis]
MNTAVKAAVAAALVMGVSSFANAAGSNTGTVTFTGTIEDSPCSIVVGDEHQTVNLGHIGTGSLMGGKESSKVDFHIGLENCAFTTEKEVSTVFSAIGNESSANPGSVALTRIGGGEMAGSSIVIGNHLGSAIKLGDAYSENLTMNGSVAAAKQTLNFKAWVKGDSAASTIDTGEFSSTVNFTISYL